MTNKKRARKYTSPVIDQLLKDVSHVEMQQTRAKMALAARLEDILKVRGWSKSEFAVKVNKNPSEITKWLSGTQNFTIDTLVEIGAVLNITVSELLAPKPAQLINRVQVVIPVKEVQQTIRYFTPGSELLGANSNKEAADQSNLIPPMSSRLQA